MCNLNFEGDNGDYKGVVVVVVVVAIILLLLV
jgi:hypothetical protein